MINLLIFLEDLILYKINFFEFNFSFFRVCLMREWIDEFIGRRSVLYV